MALHHSTWRLAISSLSIVAVIAYSAQFALGQYTFVQDTDNSGNWDDTTNWLDGGSNTTYPNAADATVLINAPTWPGPPNYNLFLPATDITVGQITIDNTNYANTFRSNIATTGGHLVFQSTAGPASYTETPGSAAGNTNTQYQFLSIVDLLSDLVITQDNYPNLNTGTTFSNLVTGASNLTITKEGYGGIQFNYNPLPGEVTFEGQFVINRGGIRMLNTGQISHSAGITVNSGGQLMLADNGGNNNTDWNMAAGAVLNLNGTGKATPAPSGVTVTNADGALRISVLASHPTTAFHNPVVLQSDSVINVSTAGTTGTLDEVVSGPGDLIKFGGGQLTLTANNTYTGDTQITSGIMSITNPYLDDSADVYLTTGGTFDLNFVATDTINALFFDGAPQPIGTYGATDRRHQYT